MVRIYLDLETYRPRKEDALVDEKIISCGLLVDEAPYCEDSLKEKGELILFSEWNELDERSIVANVHEYVAEMQKGHRFTVICGFNILRFDVPLLICKAVKHSLGKHEVFSKIWNDCFTIDYFQQLLVANDNQFKGLTLENIVKVAKRVNLKPPKYSSLAELLRTFMKLRSLRRSRSILSKTLELFAG